MFLWRPPSEAGAFTLLSIPTTPASEGRRYNCFSTCTACRPPNLLAFLFPAENGLADSAHGFLGYGSRFLRSCVDYLQYAVRMLFVFDAPLADWGDPLDQMIGHLGFAFDAADARGAAALGRPVQRLLGREQ